jgi:hypothetical protein
MGHFHRHVLLAAKDGSHLIGAQGRLRDQRNAWNER